MDNKSNKIQIIVAITAVLSLLLGIYNFCLSRLDKREVMNYSVRREAISISFFDNIFDAWLNGKRDDLGILGIQRVVINIYNNSEATISIKDIELYNFDKEGNEIKSNLNPKKTLTKDVIEPGDYATHVLVDGLFNDDTNNLIRNKIKDYIYDDINNNSCKFVCNPFQEKEGGSYEIGYLNNSLEEYTRDQNLFINRERKIKYTTSKGSAITVVDRYYGDLIIFEDIKFE